MDRRRSSIIFEDIGRDSTSSFGIFLFLALLTLGTAAVVIYNNYGSEVCIGKKMVFELR